MTARRHASAGGPGAAIVLVSTALASMTPAPAAAQQISPPIVREASDPKLSITDVTEAMRVAPMRVWREGDPVRIKGDLREEGGVLRPESQPLKRRDPLVERSRAARRLAASVLPMVPPTLGVNVD